MKTDLTGQRFERLTALRKHDRCNQGWRYFCRCDCGETIVVIGANLKRGHTKSCGCLRSEMVAAKNFVHGHSGTQAYETWCQIKKRCSRPNAVHFDRYGGRGITMCKRWRDSFEAFLADMGEPPSPRHSIDRINNDGNYEPRNCRWSLPLVQMNNTSRNRYYTRGGETLTVAEWCRALKLSHATVRMRLHRGWTIEDALTRPLRDSQRSK